MNISLLNSNSAVNSISFKSNDCAVLTQSPAFFNERETFSFSDRYKEIKKYNPAKSSIIKLMRLNESEYGSVIHSIYKSPKRANALINKEAQLIVSKTKDFYNGITDDRLGLTFSNGHGFNDTVMSSNEKGSLYTKRETSYVDSCQTTEFTDESRLNEKYTIENLYKETLNLANPQTTERSRGVEVKDNDLTPILTYSYSKKDFHNSNYSLLDINGRDYKMKVNENANVAIISGQKAAKINFSSKIADMSEGERKVFVEALRMLPPQIILSLDEDFENICSSGKHFRTGLYCPSVTAKSIVDSTVEYLAKKHSLINDKKLVETFECEREKFTEWLMYDSDGHLRKGINTYLKNNSSENLEDEIMEVIKSVCNMLWLEEYEENKTADEGIRLLLSFFPETVSFILSAFELNNISNYDLGKAA